VRIHLKAACHHSKPTEQLWALPHPHFRLPETLCAA